jgi:hypothetical protein
MKGEILPKAKKQNITHVKPLLISLLASTKWSEYKPKQLHHEQRND